MTKAQQIKTFAKGHGLTVKSCPKSHTISICGKIIWNGRTHEGWADYFANYDELYDFLIACTQSANFPWRKGA